MINLEDSFLRIDHIRGKQLYGLSEQMSIAADKTGLLFSRFMPLIGKTRNMFSSEVYDVRVFPEHYTGSPSEDFMKFAAVEVKDLKMLPEDFVQLPEINGAFAVFRHKGSADEGHKTFHFIFTEWFPNSEFVMDNRPHFDILPPGYSPMDKNAIHEIWIPVTSRSIPQMKSSPLQSNPTS